MLLNLPQHSRKFLSPLTLQTNLGHTQSHHEHINPFSTYRTLTGKFIYLIESLTNKEVTQSHPPINILHSFYIFIHLSTNISLFFTGRIHITTSAHAAALYGGLLGAFLEASRDTISQEHD